MLVWIAAMLCAAAAHAAGAPGPEALQARHAQLQGALKQSPFGRPLLVESSASSSEPSGTVYAVLEQPFDSVSRALQGAADWCNILLLQTNVKRCTAEGAAAQQRLEVAIARRYTDDAASAQPITFRYAVQAAQSDDLSVALAADEGPLGTRNYRLGFDAVPIGDKQTFIHLTYAYEPGFLARMATDAYLSSAGRDKVGFSIEGQDAEGRPRYVRGIQGVAERNTMRYFLAIEAFLQTLGVPPGERLERRLERFHAALERYPAQLHETGRDEYLAMKRREAR